VYFTPIASQKGGNVIMRKWTAVPRHPNIFSYPTAKGTRYGIRRGYKDSLGSKQEYTKSGFKDWRSAEIKLKQFEADLALDKMDKINSGKITLDRYWNLLLGRVEKNNRWRESTYASQVGNYEHHIKDRFGKYKIGDITRPLVQQWLDDGAASGYANASLRSWLITLSMTINSAVRDDFLDKNRITNIKLRGKQDKDKRLEPSDFKTWMMTAQKMMTRYDFAIVSIIAATGMRRGEACGLSVDNIAFSQDLHGTPLATISIEKSRLATTAANEPAQPLKTQTSHRRNIIKGEQVDEVRFAVLAAKNKRAEHPELAEQPCWIWQTSTGNPQYPTRLNQLMREVSKSCGVNITPHKLRHFFASQAIASNTPAIDVMHWLGHSSMQMTADYTRPTDQSTLAVYDGFSKTLH
jgi:integrase